MHKVYAVFNGTKAQGPLDGEIAVAVFREELDAHTFVLNYSRPSTPLHFVCWEVSNVDFMVHWN